MTKWLLLAGAILSEVTGSLSLKGALDRPGLYVLVAAGYNEFDPWGFYGNLRQQAGDDTAVVAFVQAVDHKDGRSVGRVNPALRKRSPQDEFEVRIKILDDGEFRPVKRLKEGFPESRVLPGEEKRDMSEQSDGIPTLLLVTFAEERSCQETHLFQYPRM